MNEWMELLPSWADILKVPLIMLIAALSVAAVVVVARAVWKLLKIAFHAVFPKERT